MKFSHLFLRLIFIFNSRFFVRIDEMLFYLIEQVLTSKRGRSVAGSAMSTTHMHSPLHTYERMNLFLDSDAFIVPMRLPLRVLTATLVCANYARTRVRSYACTHAHACESIFRTPSLLHRHTCTDKHAQTCYAVRCRILRSELYF